MELTPLSLSRPHEGPIRSFPFVHGTAEAPRAPCGPAVPSPWDPATAPACCSSHMGLPSSNTAELPPHPPQAPLTALCRLLPAWNTAPWLASSEGLPWHPRWRPWPPGDVLCPSRCVCPSPGPVPAQGRAWGGRLMDSCLGD